MQYNWEPEEVFSVTGNQLALVNAIIESNTNDPLFQNKVIEAQRTFLILDGQKMFQEILQKGIEDGKVKVVDERNLEA